MYYYVILESYMRNKGMMGKYNYIIGDFLN